ncbi:hypothetical protein AVEN_245673-1 [Araneus ventricosus]|uniref:Uncharacterized protein n=1 Tax=Araneus ventricosus TaxID=182803 RepID=A0A4Y2BP00_ARAVE|nr:hypothetical protein AVEN_245673-1 [Araneus ventricosus]
MFLQNIPIDESHISQLSAPTPQATTTRLWEYLLEAETFHKKSHNPKRDRVRKVFDSLSLKAEEAIVKYLVNCRFPSLCQTTQGSLLGWEIVLSWNDR